MEDGALSRRALIRLTVSRLLLLVLAMLILFLLPAGTWAYWQAWVYLGILLAPMLAVFTYLLRHDPALLERRMRMREKEKQQKRIQVAYSLFLIALLLPGFDRRFGWSQVPVGLVLAADLLVLLGYGLFFLVLRENSYASRVVEVEQGHKVISTGPYAVVRHPMYVAILVMYLVTPLALGSYWALIPMAVIIPIIVLRIRNEEAVLEGELPGYREYRQKVKYRLIPGLW